MTAPVTIVIPTRNRCDTLRASLATALNQDYPRLQVVVSDNASDDDTRAVVESFSDFRIRYVNTGQRVSMTDNFEFGLSHVQSGWAVMIGDDDGLLPNSLGWAIAAIEESGLRAFASLSCSYFWPSARSATGSTLSVPMGTRLQRFDSRRAIANGVRMFVHQFVMPQTYTGGIVHVDVIEKVKAVTGRFFLSQIPDYYSGFAICSVEKEFLFSERPFAIAGASSHSTGRALFDRKKNPFLQESILPFHERLPPTSYGTLAFSMPAIMIECYLKSIPLHRDFLNLSDAEILETILQESEYGREEIREWAECFADARGLSIEKAGHSRGGQRIRRRLSRMRRDASEFISRYRLVADSDLPIPTVEDASIISDVILKLRPPRLGSQFAKLLTAGRQKLG